MSTGVCNMKKKKQNKNIYCVFCGTINDIKNETCKKCNKTLTPEDHLWKDYFKGHVKDKLKGKVEDKVSSIITNYITSHLYGIAFSILFIATVITGVTSISKDDSYIKEVDEKPTIVKELALNDELVQSLYKSISLNKYGYFQEGFHVDKKITYSDLKNPKGFAYYYGHLKGEKITFTSCDDAKDYPNIYKMCQDIPSFVVGEDGLGFYTFEAKNFEDTYKNFFGNELTHGDFNGPIIEECHYYENKNRYICYSQLYGWGDSTEYLTKLAKVEKINNTIELYNYFIVCRYAEIYAFNDDKVYYVGTYKDKKQTKKISDKVILEDGSNDELFEKGQLYKHVFKSNGNGTYHWLSSEPVDSLED